MKIINPSRSTPQNDVIQKFSDENRFVASGVAKGFAIDCYSWLADFRSKAPKNLFFNPHTAFVSFYSDKDIMYSEFGNVERIYDNYPFFASFVRTKLSSHSFELDQKQYSTINNRGAEFDSIEYMSISDAIKVPMPDPIEEVPVEELESKEYNHGFWRASVFVASAYRINMYETAGGLNDYKFYDKYYFGIPELIYSQINLAGAVVYFGKFWSDIYTGSLTTFNQIKSLIMQPGDETLEYPYPSVRRILDIKFNVANQKYFYFEESSEWVAYYNDTEHYSQRKYSPPYGFVSFYDQDWKQINPISPSSGQLSDICFFPQIMRGQFIEPAKIVTVWPPIYPNPEASQSGQMALNTGVNLGESDDQSRIVYSICRHMVRKNDENFYSVHKKVDDEYLYGGIDVETERNRRYSAVVNTEPYFVTIPAGEGEIVKYTFVNGDGDPIGGTHAFDPNYNSDLFLKIKASKSMLAEIDKIINLNEKNSDIIDMLTINDIFGDYTPGVPKYSLLLTDAKYYSNFGESEDKFLSRQDDCIDDLVGIDGNAKYGIVGEGCHKIFIVPGFPGVSSDKYTMGNLKVTGLGMVSKTIIDQETKLPKVVKNLNIYCSNYVPVNAPTPGDSDYIPIPNDEKILIENPQDIVSSISQGERFCPMIRIPGVNGYIKIIERNQFFKVTRARDGMYEVVYNVEFPFCPGSYTERNMMDFSGDDPYRETFILKKSSYLNAGSWAAQWAGEDQRYDVSNDRYAPFADDSICMHSLISQFNSSGSVKTLPLTKGGGFENMVMSQKDLVTYPCDMVWKCKQFELLSLLKSRALQFRTYGTYDLWVNDDLIIDDHISKDLKLLSLVDNRKWKFSKDQFSSYIGRENPAHVYSIDVQALFEDFTKYQKTDAAIPDLKRWLYGYFSGFASTMVAPDLSVDDTPSSESEYENSIVTEKVNTMINNDLTSEKSESDIVIEIWDDLAELGDANNSGNWRPLTPVSTDTKKIPGKPIVENVHISHVTDSVNDGIQEIFVDGEGNGVYCATVGFIDINTMTFKFPVEVNYGIIGLDILDGKSNLVLYNNELMYAYHVIFVKATNDVDLNSRQLYKVYFYKYAADPDLPILNPESFDLNEIGPLSIFYPKKQISKNISFELKTSSAIQQIVDNIITRFIDIRSGEKERYVSDDQKIYFRTRVVKKKNYSQSYVSNDLSEIQYEGKDIWDDSIVNKEWINYPWSIDGVIFDSGFNWKKISPKEIVRKIGLTYFKCASK